MNEAVEKFRAAVVGEIRGKMAEHLEAKSSYQNGVRDGLLLAEDIVTDEPGGADGGSAESD